MQELCVLVKRTHLVVHCQVQMLLLLQQFYFASLHFRPDRLYFPLLSLDMLLKKTNREN